MKLDLAKVNAEFVQFECTATLPEAMISQLQILSPADEDGGFVFENAYRSSGRYHHAFAVVSRQRREEGVRIMFLYHTVETRVRPSRDHARIERLLECLSQIEATFEFSCVMSVGLREGIEKPIVTLPVKLFSGEAFPFTEIQGLRLAKVSAGKHLYSVIFDQPSGKSTGAVVQFTLSGRFSLQLPVAVLKQGRAILDRFVTIQEV